MSLEVSFSVSWQEFNAIMKLGGSSGHGSDWTTYALKNLPALKAILGESRGAELAVHIETGAIVALVPVRGSRTSQVRQPRPAETIPGPPPAFDTEEVPTKVERMPPLPFPPPLSRAPPRIEVPISPFSPKRTKTGGDDQDE